jgi:hypothetical protein
LNDYYAIETGEVTVTASFPDYFFPNGVSSHSVTVYGGPSNTFTSITAFKGWLAVQPFNTAATAYKAKVNISDLGGDDRYNWGSLGYELNSEAKNVPNYWGVYEKQPKYVSLDLSGSTFTTIRRESFRDCTGLTGITLPDSVTSIGVWAFRDCTSLTGITFPNSVTEIGQGAFQNCTNLTGSITIPNGVTRMYSDAFKGCTRLTSATIGNGPTGINVSAFDGCKNLTNITIPNSVTGIGGWAFRECYSLTSVTIPSSVTQIVKWAFFDCVNLTSVTFETGSAITSENFGSEAFPESNYSNGDWLKWAYLAGGAGTYTRPARGSTWTKQYVPVSLTGITLNTNSVKKSYTPNEMLNLVNLAVTANYSDGSSAAVTNYTASPATLTAIGDITVTITYTEGGVSKNATFTVTVSAPPVTFTGITLNTDSVKKFYNQNDTLNLANLTVTANYSDNTGKAVTGYTASPADGAALTTAGFTPVTVTYTEDGVTQTATFTVAVHEPGTAFTSIDALDAWLASQPNNTAATAYTVSLNVSDLDTDSLGGRLRKNASKYVNLDLSGSTFTSFKGYDGAYSSDFQHCTSLTGIILPNSVTSIGTLSNQGSGGPFSDCTNLASVTIGNGVTSIGDYAFVSCTGLTSVTIPESVATIGDCAFNNCTSLTSITIPNSVTSIGNSVFFFCESLTSITVGTGNTAYTAENGVLYNKTKTTLILYPAGKTEASFTIPNSVTTIADGAFFWCASLTSVTIPNSVTSIENMAFSACNSLTSVTFATGSNILYENFDDFAFSDSAALKTAYLAASPKAGTYTRTSGTASDWTKQ